MTVASVGVERWTDRTAYARFLGTSPGRSVFLLPAFLDALDRPWEFWAAAGHSGPSAGAVIFRDADGRPARAPLPFTMYQGLLLPSDEGRPGHRTVPEHLDAVAALLEGLSGEARLSWCLHPSFADVRALSWFHYDTPAAGQFRIDVRYTGLIPLDAATGFDGVLAGVRPVRRQEFRKASARFTLEASTDLELFDRLHAATFARQAIERPPREQSLLASIAAAALAHGFGELLVARDGDGTAAGAVLFLFDDRQGYYLVAANDPAYRTTGVSTWLFLSGVRRAAERRLGAVDVVGMNSPARGDFKTSFGAVPVPYYVATWERP
ncbi:MAG: GNAT family N-acetyltransferase [Gemmatimonadales bacterium]